MQIVWLSLMFLQRGGTRIAVLNSHLKFWLLVFIYRLKILHHIQSMISLKFVFIKDG